MTIQQLFEKWMRRGYTQSEETMAVKYPKQNLKAMAFHGGYTCRNDEVQMLKDGLLKIVHSTPDGTTRHEASMILTSHAQYMNREGDADEGNGY